MRPSASLLPGVFGKTEIRIEHALILPPKKIIKYLEISFPFGCGVEVGDILLPCCMDYKVFAGTANVI